MSENKFLIYVDGVSGDDSNTGDILSPVRTLQHAYDIANNGATIILQVNGYSYGNIAVSKNIILMSAYGTRSYVGEVSITNAQAYLLGLDFNSTTGIGVYIDNVGIGRVGSLQVNECSFVDITYPIILENCNYASIHRNRFDIYDKAIQINGCSEFTASANTFASGPKAFEVLNTNYLDIYNNTFFGILGSIPGGTPNIDLRVIYVTIDSGILSRKYIDLPSYAYPNSYGYAVAINVVNGSSFNYGIDYIVQNTGKTVYWSGKGMESLLHVGDILRIAYSDAALGSSGEIIYAHATNSNSRVDSNNINDSDVGVHFLGNIKVKNNNFYNTTTWIDGAPSETGGNFSSDPLYEDKPNGDYRLQPSSPDIGVADSSRRGQILEELGVGLTGGGFTGIFSVQREGVAPFNRNIDKDGRHRHTLSNSYDIGAYEYPNTGANPEPYTYVSEDGYDVDVPGSYTGPYGTIERAYHDTGIISIRTNPLMSEGYTGPIDQGATGSRYGRYSSDDFKINNNPLLIGQDNKDSIVYIYPSYPSCGLTGVFVGPKLPDSEVSGDTGCITNPFIDIKDAINGLGSNPGTIFVYPSYYSTFEGYTGINIVGLPKTNQIDLGKTTYNTFEPVGWTGANFATFNNKNAYFNGPDEVASLFDMLNGFSVRFDFIIPSDIIEAKVFNTSNYISVIKSGSTVFFKYYTGGSSYTVSTLSVDTSFRASITVKDDRGVIKLKGISPGATTDITRDISLISGYTGMWGMKYSYTGISGITGILSNLLIEADQILISGSSDIRGYTGTSTGRKVYGIVGDNGVTGLIFWHGAGL